MMFADLHCHPALFGFNRLRHSVDDENPDRFHPWSIPDAVDHRAMAEGRRAASYTQCTMPMLAESKTRLAFASITPIEKGFFFGAEDVAEETRFEIELFKLVSGTSLVTAASRFLTGRRDDAAREMVSVLRNRGAARRALQRAFMRYDDQRVRFMMSDEYDYFEELLRELDFYRNADDHDGAAVLHTPNGPAHQVAGKYQIVKTAGHLEEVLEHTEDVALVMTIEGAHPISVRPDGLPYSREQIEEHLSILKDLDFPILFITLAHHFQNWLCGHAHSLPDAAHWVMSQKSGMGEGYTALGRWVTSELLDLDEHLRPRGGRRILVDCKHMSPRARREYYSDIVRPHNAWAKREDAPLIPVIASHSAYSGVKTLGELIANEARENDHWHRNPFLAWGINHSDEDVREVFDSRGLIGLCFDQRICGVPPRQVVPREAWADILFRQILATVDVVLQDERLGWDERMQAWDIVCIGSDFDGLIDPVTAYPTALHFQAFADDLAERLEDVRHTRGIESVGVERLVEKICWRNAYEFALRNL